MIVPPFPLQPPPIAAPLLPSSAVMLPPFIVIVPAFPLKPPPIAAHLYSPVAISLPVPFSCAQIVSELPFSTQIPFAAVRFAPSQRIILTLPVTVRREFTVTSPAATYQPPGSALESSLITV